MIWSLVATVKVAILTGQASYKKRNAADVCDSGPHAMLTPQKVHNG